MKRRDFLGAGAGALALAGCEARVADIEGGFTGINVARGHALRDGTLGRDASGGSRAAGGGSPGHDAGTGTPARTLRTRVLIAGGGVAGLAAARALRLGGVEDFALLELEDEAGGNARGGAVGGIACPLGAHYLPVPGDDAREVQDLLEELGLRRRVAGRWEYDEFTLCHSPQERLFFRGQWQDGLLPVQGVGAATLAQYRRLAARVEALRRQARFVIPTLRAPLTPTLLELDAMTFARWLDREGLTDPHLRWYLDYCCRDDYGAGLEAVSAWGGIHYFASRHGFHAPGDDTADPDERDAVLTWPEGNGWLTRRLAAPLGERLRTGQVVLRIDQTRSGVELDAYDAATGTTVRWQAQRCIVALPVFIAARVVQNPPERLRRAAAALQYAPWLVANAQVRMPPADRPGAAPSWDNVLYGTPGLGYVDARHQALDPTPRATVLSWYRPLGPSRYDGADFAAGRRRLLATPWATWRDALLAELSAAHPDLPALVSRIDITRYGHAMAIPTPGLLSQIGPQPSNYKDIPLSNKERPGLAADDRLAFAHADWSGYSVFEEAFTRGHLAGTWAAAD